MNKNWYWKAAFIVVGVLLGAGVIFLVTRPPRGEPIVLLPAPTQSPIIVYVSGSVRQPGLYKLPLGSRLNDAIQVAGGFSTEADPSSLNLAEILEDGEKIVVPSISSPTTYNPATGPNPTYHPQSGTPSPLMVDINNATVEELDTLPEIGPKTAQAIIDYRNTNGPFKRIEEIMDVNGIGSATFERIKDLITVGEAP